MVRKLESFLAQPETNDDEQRRTHRRQQPEPAAFAEAIRTGSVGVDHADAKRKPRTAEHYRDVIESEFETRNLTSGETSRFSITFGAHSPIAETPIRIVYRPRWWFEAELLLAEEHEAPNGRETTWNLGAH